jgi:hypothetical protein
LDVVGVEDGTGSVNVTIDGTTSTFSSVINSSQHTIKIVSGLPYGTHTVKIERGASSSLSPSQFVIYGPKKPSIPANTVELADYNIMADFVANATAGINNIATGTLRKQISQRESTIIGAGWVFTPLNATSYSNGWQINTPTNGQYFEYTFFGTGFEFRGQSNTAFSATNTVQLQNLSTGGSLSNLTVANFATATFSTYGGFSYASPPTLSQAASNTFGSGFRCSGLPLALYKIRIANGTSTAMVIETFDVITPIHSAKSNLYADIQNTLTVGSNAISDNRQTSPLKEVLSSQKAWSQAVGISTSATTTTAGNIPIPDMSLTIKTNGGPVEISYGFSGANNTLGALSSVVIFCNGVAVSSPKFFQQFVANYAFSVSDSIVIPLSAGVHKIELCWFRDAGTLSVNDVRRNVTAREL